MSEKVRIGIIGAGAVSDYHHVPGIRLDDRCELVAVCDPNAALLERRQTDWGPTKKTTNYEELANDPDVDAVIVATPPHLHHQMVIAALEAGKHVVCEKPMARSLAEARDMVKLANSASVIATVNHEFRYLPIRQRVKELIDEGYIGEAHSVTMNVFRDTLADPNERPFSWLMEADKAGGMLGASGSRTGG